MESEKPLIEFIARVSRLSPERYVIYIPKSVRPIARRLHGKEVRVLLFPAGEEK